MIIAVVGKGRNCRPEVADLARHIGRDVAASGHVLVCGGLGGVMAAAAEGARIAGGTVLGIVPNEADANEHCSIVVRTGLPPTVRNVVIGTCCDAMLALDGSHGTMQEFAVALDRGAPVAAVETDRWCPLVADVLTRDDVRPWLKHVFGEAINPAGSLPDDSAPTVAGSTPRAG